MSIYLTFPLLVHLLQARGFHVEELVFRLAQVFLDLYVVYLHFLEDLEEGRVKALLFLVDFSQRWNHFHLSASLWNESMVVGLGQSSESDMLILAEDLDVVDESRRCLVEVLQFLVAELVQLIEDVGELSLEHAKNVVSVESEDLAVSRGLQRKVPYLISHYFFVANVAPVGEEFEGEVLQIQDTEERVGLSRNHFFLLGQLGKEVLSLREHNRGLHWMVFFDLCRESLAFVRVLDQEEHRALHYEYHFSSNVSFLPNPGILLDLLRLQELEHVDDETQVPSLEKGTFEEHWMQLLQELELKFQRHVLEKGYII